LGFFDDSIYGFGDRSVFSFSIFVDLMLDEPGPTTHHSDTTSWQNIVELTQEQIFPCRINALNDQFLSRNDELSSLSWDTHNPGPPSLPWSLHIPPPA
jgi:hypothetical protein